MTETIVELKKHAIRFDINTRGMERHELVAAVESARASHAARERVAPPTKQIHKEKRARTAKSAKAAKKAAHVETSSATADSREVKEARQKVELYEHVFDMLGGIDPKMGEELEAARAERDELQRASAQAAA